MTPVSAAASPSLVERRTAAAAAAAPPSDITKLNTAQVAKLTAKQVAGLSDENLKAMSAQQIGALSATSVAALTGTQIGLLSATQVAGFKTTQIAKFTASAVGGLTADHVRALSAEQIGAISAVGMKGLTTSAAAALSSAQVGAIQPAAFKSLGAAQLNALGASKIGGLATAQVTALTETQIEGLNDASLGALAVSKLTTAQLGGLADTVAGRLSNAQVKSLTDKQIGALSADAAGALTSTQTQGLSSVQRNAMKATLVGDAGGLRIKLVWGASTSKAPAGFRDAVVAAAKSFTDTYSNNIRVNIQVGFGESHGTKVSANAAAQSASPGILTNYATVRNALLQDAGNSTYQATADATLGASDPTGGKQFYMSSAQQKALGLASAESNAIDGYIGLSSALAMDYAHSGASGKFDAVGAMQHEISEVLGRTGSVGQAFGSGVYTALDLFRYKGQNARALTAGSSTGDYFSIDGGRTNLGSFNAASGGDDYADWSQAEAPDAYGFSSPGTKASTPARDVIEMAVLGYNLTAKGQDAAKGAGVSVTV